MGKTSPKDLKVRLLSSIVMLAVTGGALWAGGWVFTVFVLGVAARLLWEWWGLISKFNASARGRLLWLLAGVFYIGFAVNYLQDLKTPQRFGLIILVVATDVGAYLFGRFIGGRKFLPSVSPNKTWSGLIGGLATAGAVAIVLALLSDHRSNLSFQLPYAFGFGCMASLFAQMGDFFESWLKRQAHVKDTGTLIPGHGGLFDRLDGLVALLFIQGFSGYLLINVVSLAYGGGLVGLSHSVLTPQLFQ